MFIDVCFITCSDDSECCCSTVCVCVCVCVYMRACVHASTVKAASTLDCHLACVWLICICLLVVHASSSVQMTMSALVATCVVSRCASTPQAATTASAAAASASTSTSCPVSVSASFTRQTVETFMMEDPDWSVQNMSSREYLFGFGFWHVIAQTFTSRVCISWMPQNWMTFWQFTRECVSAECLKTGRKLNSLPAESVSAECLKTGWKLNSLPAEHVSAECLKIGWKFDRVLAKTTPLGQPLCDWFSKVLAHHFNCMMKQYSCGL